MHKKFLGIGLPILGAALIVGAGFSAWAFEDETATAAVHGTVEVTEKLASFETHLYYRYIAKYSDNHGDNETNPVYTYAELTTFTLELDQGELYDTTTADIGITGYIPNVTYTDDSNPLSETTSQIDVLLDNNIFIEVRYRGTTDQLTDSYNRNNKLTISFALDYHVRTAQGVANPYVLETYVDLATATKTPTAAVEFTQVSTTTLSSFGGSTVTDYVIYQSSGVPFDWVWATDANSETPDIAKPENSTEYDNMLTNLTESPAFSLTFTASPAWAPVA